MRKLCPVQAVKLDERGIARFFGELEARIMEAVWSLDEPTVHDICRYLGADCNYKTIMTVANRLTEKGALVRVRRGRAYVYTAVSPRDDFLEKISKETLVGLVMDFGTTAFAGFVGAMQEFAPEQLENLRQLINEKLPES